MQQEDKTNVDQPAELMEPTELRQETWEQSEMDPNNFQFGNFVNPGGESEIFKNIWIWIINTSQTLLIYIY